MKRMKLNWGITVAYIKDQTLAWFWRYINFRVMKSTLLFAITFLVWCLYFAKQAAAAPGRAQGLLLKRDGPIKHSVHTNDCTCTDSPEVTKQCCTASKGGTSDSKNGKCSFSSKDGTWNEFTSCCIKNNSSSSCQSNDVLHIQYDTDGNVITSK